jgi:hypothetical protein
MKKLGCGYASCQFVSFLSLAPTHDAKDGPACSVIT